MKNMLKPAAGMMAGVLILAGCGSPDPEAQGTAMAHMRQLVAQRMAGGAGATPPAPALSADEMAARALAANPAPLILVSMESSGISQVMAMTGENGAMRTYMTPNMQAVILTGGIVTGTKGLGHDLSTAEVDASAALIHARRGGQAARTNRYLSGDGLERPLPMTCAVATGQPQSFAFAGTGWNATQVTETCRAGAAEIQNSYLVTASGQIPVSRQWIGPQLGYVTIQVIRP
ncbi:MAG: YjbF family lipoprotein [Paracoccus sp. (in: a-proteobacteria)]|nr:YjbF family lipoprotein [Paracoccus sp. (in: a-proteobacteria)]